MEHSNKNCLLLVAKIGRLVGVNGALKLHIMSDFLSIFAPQATFYLQSPAQISFNQSPNAQATLDTIRIHSFDTTKNLVIFQGYESRESAAKLVNYELYSTLIESKKILKQGEILWQELIGTAISDTTDTKQRNLGVVKDIERIAKIDYFLIQTHTELVSQGLPKQFYIPNISQYVLNISTDCIATQNAFLLLQES